MKNQIASAIVFMAVLFNAATSQAAAVSTAFSYQGRLFDAGIPANGLFEMEFVLRDQPAQGAQIGTNV